MTDKCKGCGKKVIRFPIWKGQEDGEEFSWDKLIFFNLFKVDLMTILWIAVIIIMIVAYKADTETCKEIVTRPLKYCEESNACKIIEERKNKNPLGIIDMSDLDINISVLKDK